MTRVAAFLLCLGGVAAAQDFKVEGTLGTLDDASVQLVVQKQGAALEACYKGEAGKKRYLGGAVQLKLRVARDGAVKSALAASELGSWEVEKCLVRVARGMRFSKPKGGEAEVVLPLEFPATRPAAAGDGGELSGELRSLASCSGGPGAVDVTAYVGPGGKVTSAGFSAEAPFSDAWGDCAVGKLRALKLTDPHGKIVRLAARLEK